MPHYGNDVAMIIPDKGEPTRIAYLVVSAALPVAAGSAEGAARIGVRA
jgi:hypothetical protein